MTITTSAVPRVPLSRWRVLQAAIDIADDGGIESLSMRRLGQALGVEAMSLYNRARNKEDILNGIVDVVVGEIDLVPHDGPWLAIMRRQVGAARVVLRRHLWMPRVMETQADPGLATMSYLLERLRVAA